MKFRFYDNSHWKFFSGDKSDQSICVYVYICIWVNVKFVCLCIFAFVYMCICVFVLVKKYCGGVWVESFGGWRLEWPQWRNLSRECKHRLHIISTLARYCACAWTTRWTVRAKAGPHHHLERPECGDHTCKQRLHTTLNSSPFPETTGPQIHCYATLNCCSVLGTNTTSSTTTTNTTSTTTTTTATTTTTTTAATTTTKVQRLPHDIARRILDFYFNIVPRRLKDLCIHIIYRSWHCCVLYVLFYEAVVA